jgi:signal transduction histidine kinase
VQAIAVAHGGQATLESWPGHGTRVRIWLPTPVIEPSHDHEGFPSNTTGNPS